MTVVGLHDTGPWLLIYTCSGSVKNDLQESTEDCLRDSSRVGLVEDRLDLCIGKAALPRLAERGKESASFGPVRVLSPACKLQSVCGIISMDASFLRRDVVCFLAVMSAMLLVVRCGSEKKVSLSSSVVIHFLLDFRCLLTIPFARFSVFGGGVVFFCLFFFLATLVMRCSVQL